MEIAVIDHPDADPPAIAAATVVLVRDGGGGIEVLMVHRGDATVFGGMWAFPGGAVDPADVPPGTAPDPVPAAKRAAVREAREEVGLHVDVDSLTWWSHWLPPVASAQRKRFSTWFFVAAGEWHHADEHVDVDGREIFAHRWLPPDVALGLQERGEIELAAPTFVTLQQLRRYGDVAAVLEPGEPKFFATEIAVVGGVRHCLWAGDAAYGVGDPSVAGPRHRLVMDPSDGWRYLDTIDGVAP